MIDCIAMFSSPLPLFPLLFYLDEHQKNQFFQADVMKNLYKGAGRINGLTVVVYSYGIIVKNLEKYFTMVLVFVLKVKSSPCQM